MISIIEPSPHDAATAYVAANRYKSDDFAPYLYKTTDYGQTWTTITDGIAENAFTRVIRADPDRTGLLYAGTETGLYVSFDDGAHWQSLAAKPARRADPRSRGEESGPHRRHAWPRLLDSGRPHAAPPTGGRHRRRGRTPLHAAPDDPLQERPAPLPCRRPAAGLSLRRRPGRDDLAGPETGQPPHLLRGGPQPDRRRHHQLLPEGEARRAHLPHLPRCAKATRSRPSRAKKPEEEGAHRDAPLAQSLRTKRRSRKRPPRRG